MSRTWHDWQPLGWSTDPIPGDADAVGATATQYRTAAQHLYDAASNLRRLRGDTTCSEAVTKIVASSQDLARQLDAVRTRYEAAGAALSRYAPALQQAQAASLVALSEASTARHRYDQADARLHVLHQSARSSTDAHQRQSLIDAFYVEKAKREAAATSVGTAKARLQAAIDARDRAAATAARDINAVVHGSSVNDSMLDRFKHVLDPVIDAVKKVAKWVWDHIDEISLVLTVLSIVFAGVPGVGLALLVLARVANALAILKMSFQVYRGVAQAIRTGDWGPALTAGGELLLVLVGGKVAKRLLGGVGAKAGRKLAGLTNAGINKYTKWLGHEVDRHVTRMYGRAVSGARAGSTVQDAIRSGRLTREYQPLYREVRQLYRASNSFVRDRAHDVDAIVRIARGGDAVWVKEDLDALSRLGRRAGISDATRDTLARLQREAVERGVDEGIDQVRDYASGKIADRFERDSDAHRLATQTCGAP